LLGLKKVGVCVYALTLILRKVSRVTTHFEMIVTPSVVFAWSTDFDISRSGRGYVLAILVYAIGYCSVIGAMSQYVGYIEGNPSARLQVNVAADKSKLVIIDCAS
jgi:hypothetical protein